MKLLNRAYIEAHTANPTPEGLRGFNVATQLQAALRTALKPALIKRLHEHRSERARLVAECDRWSLEAYNTKLDAIAARAHAGDLEAAAAIENGAVPSKQSYHEMGNRCWTALESFDRDSRALFGEVLPLVGEPMTKVVDRAQVILDQMLEALGVPRFELLGWRSHISFQLLQIGAASRNESCDLSWFWQSIDS